MHPASASKTASACPCVDTVNVGVPQLAMIFDAATDSSWAACVAVTLNRFSKSGFVTQLDLIPSPQEPPVLAKMNLSSAPAGGARPASASMIAEPVAS